MLNWHVCLCGHRVVLHILIKKGRDSRKAAKPTWELKNGCLDIFYAHIQGLAFDLAQPNREQRQSRHGELFSSARESNRQQMESSWGRASAWENDSDLGASLAWVTAQDTQTHCCFCYSLQSSSLGRANPPKDHPWWDLCPCLPLLCCPLAPRSSPASPASSLRPSLSSLFCGHLANPSGPLLIYPYHHSLIFSAESGVCICCMRGSIYKQYSGHCHYLSA